MKTHRQEIATALVAHKIVAPPEILDVDHQVEVIHSIGQTGAPETMILESHANAQLDRQDLLGLDFCKAFFAVWGPAERRAVDIKSRLSYMDVEDLEEDLDRVTMRD